MRGALAFGCAALAAAAACSAFSSGDPSTPADLPDAAATDGSSGDAATDAGGLACGHDFCDYFDDPPDGSPSFARWTSFEAIERLSRSNDFASSPPFALRLTATSAQLRTRRTRLDAVLLRRPNAGVRCGINVGLEQAPGGARVAELKMVGDGEVTALAQLHPSAHNLGVSYRFADGGTAYEDGYTLAGDAAAPAGGVVSVRVALELSPTPRATLSLDGAVVTSKLLSFVPTGIEEVRFSIGALNASFVDGGAFDLYFDDAYCDVE
jgi:hypothetical protein